MVTLTPELLADLRKKAEDLRDNPTPDNLLMHMPEESLRDAMTADVVLALLDRIEALEKVGAAVRPITEDVAKNGNLSDAPYVSQEEAVVLLSIIDGGRHA